MKSVKECLEYLVETDERFGQLKGSAKYYAEYKAKLVKAQEFLAASGTKDERESRAYASANFATVMDEKKEIDTELETIAAKRKTCELIIEVWRSKNANRRAGNI